VNALVRQRTSALQDLAYRDGLTGLPNRRYFNWYLEHYLPRQRVALQSQVVLFDLNGFNSVNDTYGHGAGDALLKFISDTLTTYLPQNTVLARLGGDEFVVLVRDRKGGRKIQTVTRIVRQAVSSALIFGPPSYSGLYQRRCFRPLLAGFLLPANFCEADQRMYEDKAAHYEESGVAG